MTVRFSISLRLTAWISAVFICGFIAFGAGMWFDLAYSLSQGRTKTVTARVRRLAELLESTQFDTAERESAKFNDFVEATPEGRFIQVYDLSGSRVYPEPAVPAIEFPWPHEARAGNGDASDVTYLDRRYRVLSRRVELRPKPLVVRVAGQLEDNRLLLRRFLIGLLGAAPAMLALSALCGYFLSRRALDPVDRLTASVRSISIGNLSRRLPLSNTGDELERLAETCNDMLARLEGAVSQITRFTADASHELRGPLSMVRIQAELALRNPHMDSKSADAFRAIVAEAEGAALLLEDMLTLARSDAGHAGTVFEPVDLRGLLAEVCSRIAPLAETRQHALSVNVDANVDQPVLGDEPSLRRLFWILLDNAIKYTPPGGKIAVSLERVGDRSCVTVTDSGIGIPEAALPHIFDRFYRADASRSYEEGTGLGLAIAKWIADVHLATLTAQSVEQRGTSFQVVFPLQA